MDIMSINSTFLRELISKKINKMLEKKLGVDPEIVLEDFDCSSEKIAEGCGKTTITLSISLPTIKFRKILQEVIK